MHQSHITILTTQAFKVTEDLPERYILARYEPNLVKNSLHFGHADSLLAFKNTFREFKGSLLTFSTFLGGFADWCLAGDCLIVHLFAIEAHQVGG